VGLTSRGDVDWILLRHFASTALDDAARLGKGVVKVCYNYWNGCSVGGHQGYMMAQG